MKEKKEVAPKVVQQADEPAVPAEIIAQSIVRLDEAFKKMTKAGLKTEAVVLLLHDYSGVGKPAIRLILQGLNALRGRYTTR